MYGISILADRPMRKVDMIETKAGFLCISHGSKKPETCCWDSGFIVANRVFRPWPPGKAAMDW